MRKAGSGIAALGNASELPRALIITIITINGNHDDYHD
jgi:hypothetical protein